MSDSNPSPPFAKGSYNIDWDNFDPSMNPFETSSKIKNISPPSTPNAALAASNSLTKTTSQIKLTPGNNLTQNGGIKKQQKTQIKIKSSAKSPRSPVIAVVTPALQAGGDQALIANNTPQTNLTAAGDFHANNTKSNNTISDNITDIINTKDAINENQIPEGLESKDQAQLPKKVNAQDSLNTNGNIQPVVKKEETDKNHGNNVDNSTTDDKMYLNKEVKKNEDNNNENNKNNHTNNTNNTNTTTNTLVENDSIVTNDTNTTSDTVGTNDSIKDSNISNDNILSETSKALKRKPVLSSTFRKSKTSKSPSKLNHPVIANPDDVAVSLTPGPSRNDNIPTSSPSQVVNTPSTTATPKVSTSNEPITASKISASIDAACTDSGFSQSMTSTINPHEVDNTATIDGDKVPSETLNVGFDSFSGMCALKTGERIGDICDLMGEDKTEMRLKAGVDSDAKTPSEDFKDASDEFYDTPTWDMLQNKITPKLKNNDLIAFSPATDSKPGDELSTQSSSSPRYSSSDLLRIQKDMELKFKTHLLNKEREWSHKEEQARMEFAMRLKEHEVEKNDLKEKVTCLKNTLDNMKKVVTEYENTLKKLLDDKEKWNLHSKQSNNSLVQERDQALEDLQNVEKAFADQHRRYEKCKNVLEGYVKNEEVLKKCVLDLQDKCKKKDEKYRALKDHADAKMAEASEKMEKVRKAAENNNIIQQAALKKAELHNKSLEASIDQKIRENKELTVICDELIERVNV